VSNNKVTRLKPRSKPAAALDTPTDLDHEAVKAVSKALKTRTSTGTSAAGISATTT